MADLLPDHSNVTRSHVRHANAWCDTGSCRWSAEGTGNGGVRRVRRQAIAHVESTGHEVALDVTSLDRYSLETDDSQLDRKDA